MGAHVLSEARKAAGETAEAAQLDDESFEWVSQVAEEPSTSNAQLLEWTGQSFSKRGLPQKAAPLLNRAVEMRETLASRGAPSASDGAAAESLLCLADIEIEEGDLDGALALARRSAEVALRSDGDSHPNYARAIVVVADYLTLKSDYPEAKPLLEKALEIQEESFGKSDPYAISIVHRLARMENLQGRFEDAEPLFQRALTAYQGALGGNHATVTAIEAESEDNAARKSIRLPSRRTRPPAE